jgi:hypothetical protein
MRESIKITVDANSNNEYKTEKDERRTKDVKAKEKPLAISHFFTHERTAKSFIVLWTSRLLSYKWL